MAQSPLNLIAAADPDPGYGQLLAVLMRRRLWLIGGLGMGLAFPSHTLVVFAHAPSGEEGKVSGNLQMVDVLGAALSAGIGGALIAGLGLSTGFTVLYSLTVCAALIGIAVAGKLSSSLTGDL